MAQTERYSDNWCISLARLLAQRYPGVEDVRQAYKDVVGVEVRNVPGSDAYWRWYNMLQGLVVHRNHTAVDVIAQRVGW